MPVRRLFVLAAALTATLAAAALARGSEDDALGIPQVSARFSGREVRVEARLSAPLPPEVRQRLESGLPTTAVWEVRLFVSREAWWDGLKDERHYEVTASRRPVSGDYAVERRLDGRLLETAIVAGRDDAERALSALPGLPCFTMGRTLAGKPLVVRVRCVYATAVALGFVPTRVSTGWRRSPVFVWNESGTAP